MTVRPPSAVLAEAAEAAGFAPSIHNTQPWRWRVADDRLELFADRSRQLQVADPEGRMLTISCGAALHHAVLALLAEGFEAQVERLAEGDLLARLRLGAHVGSSPDAVRHFQAIRVRHTDRRPVSDTPVGEEALEVLRRASSLAGIDFHVLNEDQLADLSVASARADAIEVMDHEQRQELAYWIGGDRSSGMGVPDSALLEGPARTAVPGRDFVRPGTLDPGEGSDRAARYAVLFGTGDEPADWLRAGEALSACWLAATELGLSVLPFSAVIEVPATREVLRRALAGIGYPYLVLRLGVADADTPGPPHTPRLPAEQIIVTEVSDALPSA